MSPEARPIATSAGQRLDAVGDRLRRVADRARAAKDQATAKARVAATRLSTNLSRTAFVGVILLPLVNVHPAPETSIEPAAYRRHHYFHGRSTIRTRPVHVETVPAPVETSLPTSPAAPVGETAPVTPETHPEIKREHRAQIPEPAKPQGERAVDPAKETRTAAADPEKPAHPIDTAMKDKPAPPPPVPPSGQPAAPWTDEQIAAANSECDRLLKNVTVVAVAEPPEREGICGAPAPRTLKSLGQSHVTVEPPQMLNCPMIAGLHTWLSDKLQPAAQKVFGSPIVRILGAASYSCRNRYGLAKAPVSEHAFMNALDISGFALANGRIIRVSHDWKAPRNETLVVSAEPPSEVSKEIGKKHKTLVVAASKLGATSSADGTSPNGKANVAPKKLSPAESKRNEEATKTSAFLHEVHDDACAIFGTVLGPDANDAHHDHFHLDMKERKYHSICQ